MMMKTWVWLLLAGFGWCAFIVGIIFGGVGDPRPAYVLGMGEVIAAVFMTFLPFVIGIHAGVSYVRECEANKGTL